MKIIGLTQLALAAKAYSKSVKIVISFLLNASDATHLSYFTPTINIPFAPFVATLT